MSEIESILRDSAWVQSPQWPEVKDLLASLNLGNTYYARGSGLAKNDLSKIVEQHRQWVANVVHLEDFRHCYLTHGATEGINHWRLTDSRPWQFLVGEYQWPQILSGNGRETTLDQLASDRVLYLSNPSSRDGNFLSDHEIAKINSVGCPVVLDCVYVGATAARQMPMLENTEQILFSFSKGWGLIGQRAGLLYAKQPHASLKFMERVECWNYQTAVIIGAIMSRYSVEAMHQQGQARQLELCQRYNLVASDTYFIANSTDRFYERQMRIKNLARLCLTPAWSRETSAFQETVS